MREERGIIKRYFPAKGYGFIARSGEPKDVFFHCSQVYYEDQPATIQEQMLVEFDIEQSDKGLRAVNILLV